MFAVTDVGGSERVWVNKDSYPRRRIRNALGEQDHAVATHGPANARPQAASARLSVTDAELPTSPS